MKKLCAAGLMLASSVQAADYCEFSKSLDISVPAADLATLDLTAGSGNLEINGQVGASEVEVIATACASSRKLLDGLSLDQRISSDTLRLETREREAAFDIAEPQLAVLLQIIPKTRAPAFADERRMGCRLGEFVDSIEGLAETLASLRYRRPSSR